MFSECVPDAFERFQGAWAPDATTQDHVPPSPQGCNLGVVSDSVEFTTVQIATRSCRVQRKLDVNFPGSVLPRKPPSLRCLTIGKREKVEPLDLSLRSTPSEVSSQVTWPLCRDLVLATVVEFRILTGPNHCVYSQ